MKFTRRDASSDSLVETLTIVRLPEELFCDELGRDTPFGVEVTEPSTGHVSVHDLDGAELSSWFGAAGSREIAVDAEIPADVIDAVESGWAQGSNVVERA